MTLDLQQLLNEHPLTRPIEHAGCIIWIRIPTEEDLPRVNEFLDPMYYDNIPDWTVRAGIEPCRMIVFIRDTQDVKTPMGIARIEDLEDMVERFGAENIKIIQP